MLHTHGLGANMGLLTAVRAVYVQCNKRRWVSNRRSPPEPRITTMINRLFALLALTSRRMDSIESFSAEVRTNAMESRNFSGLSAAATTRW